MKRFLVVAALFMISSAAVPASHAWGIGHRGRGRPCRCHRKRHRPSLPPVCPNPIEPIIPPVVVVPSPRPEFDPVSLRSPVLNNGRPIWDAVFCMSRISELVYEDEPVVRQQLVEWGFESKCITVDSMVVHVAWNDDALVIAFRGTNELADWVVNLNFATHAIIEGRVHAGWYSAYKSLEPQILEALPADGERPRKVWITGHSLGGALAVACDYAFVKRRLPVSSTVTFGQPMVVDSRMAAFLGASNAGRYVRVVNENDIVTKIPPWTFVHFGKLAWFRGESVIVRGRQRGIVPARPLHSDGQFPQGQRRLTDAEFRRLKRFLAEHRNEVDEKRGVTAAAAHEGYGGFMPMIEDHAVANYVEKSRVEMLHARTTRSR